MIYGTGVNKRKLHEFLTMNCLTARDDITPIFFRLLIICQIYMVLHYTHIYGTPVGTWNAFAYDCISDYTDKKFAGAVNIQWSRIIQIFR